jgi:leader peptidase (prepilin peptidase)/N-methyltransferase
MRDLFHFIQTTHPWYLGALAFYLGACVGSFLNVCILRIPAGKSIVTPRSHCVCGKMIAWHDNIPILSWFILRGRARCCGQKFSIRYSIIEAATACTYLWLWMTMPPALAISGMVFFSLLLLGAMIDLDHMELPDLTTIGGMFVGIALSALWPQIHHIAPSPYSWIFTSVHSVTVAVIGAVVGAGVVFWVRELGEIFFRKEAMGMGDVLLMGCGWHGAVFSLFGGAFIALLVILPWMAFAWALRKPGTEPATPTVPVMDASAQASAKPTDNLAPAVTAETSAEPESRDSPTFGVEVPFGPWLSLAGFLYYAWPLLHHGVDNYFAILHAMAFGEVPPAN